MTWERDFDAAFKQLKGEFKHRTKRNFLEDVRAEFEDNERLQRLLSKRRSSRYVAVTFDRRQNDQGFSYGYFDLLLVALDALSGGSGIYKPANQFRVVQWNYSRSGLREVLRHFARMDPRVRFRRLLILPYPEPVVGVRCDHSVYRR